MIKRVLLIVGGLVLLLIVGLLAYCYSLPQYVHVEREIEIAAPPDVVYAQVDDFHQWDAWEPWGKDFDPSVTHTYAGPDSGEGAERSWKGDPKKSMSGRQKITLAKPHEKVAMDVWFEGETKPAQAEFVIKPTDTGSHVTWSFDCDMGMNPIGRFFGGLMDGMLGPDYEKGLAKLKEVAEEKAKERE